MKLKEVLKAKKSILKAIEDELYILQNKINVKNNHIVKLKQEIKDSKMGDIKEYYEFLIFRNGIDNIRFEIEQEKNNLDSLHMQKTILNEKLKNAMIEYEKIAFIHNEEMQRYKKMLDKREQDESDNISGILQYARRRNEKI